MRFVHPGESMAGMLEQSIQQLLQGAASVLGSEAAALILFDEKADRLTLSLGVHRQRTEDLREAEGLLGTDIRGLAVPISSISESLIVRCWREARIFETSTLADLTDHFFDTEAVQTVDRLIGEHSFACVPALGSRRVEGVVIFVKAGAHGYAPVQRRLLLQYAGRVAQLVEGERLGRQAADLLELGEETTSEAAAGFLILDRQLEVIQAGGSETLPAPGVGAPLADWLEDLEAAGVQGARKVADELAAWLRAGVEPAWKTGLASGAGLEQEGHPLELHAARLEPDHETVLLQWIDMRQPEGFRRRLAAMQERLPLILSGTESAVLCVSPELEIVSHNELADRLFRCRTGDLVGRDLADLVAEQGDLELVGRLRLIAFGYLDQVLPLRRSDDTSFPAHLMGLLLADESGEPAGALLCVRDLGEVRAWEQDRTRLEQQVERSEQLATMGQMAAQLAHELRNPLVAIGATVQGLIEDPHEPGELSDELALVGAEVARLDSLLRDYLALAGHLRYRPGRVNLAEVARSARSLVAAAAAARDCTLQGVLPETLWARADFDAMRQVLVNLLLNAIQVSPQGRPVKLETGEENGSCWIRVTDQGPGIPPAERERVFEPFYSTRRGGTGLGLTVSRRIVEDLGGRLEFEDLPSGQGCCARAVLRAAVEGAE